MDQKGDSIIETVTGTPKYYQFNKKTIQFLVPVSLFSILFFYFSGFSCGFPYNIQSSRLVLPQFGRSLERKYMFLICNGILAFLAQNSKFSSSSLNYSGFMNCDDDGVKQITEPFQILKEASVQENVVDMEYANSSLNVAVAEDIQMAQQQEVESEGSLKGDEEMKTGGFTVETEEYWEEEEDQEEEEEEEELEKSRTLESTSSMEDTSYASVSTEELNKKFEEFIRKMKEEIRIDARRQLITV